MFGKSNTAAKVPAVSTSADQNEKSQLPQQQPAGWKRLISFRKTADESSSVDSAEDYKDEAPVEKWSLGILNDKKTEEVPGTVLLLSSNRNEPLGLRHQPEQVSASSLPSPFLSRSRAPSVHSAVPEKKKTADGQILLEPQPDDSLNDPLNWANWRRNSALLSLGFYCMLGGGMTPILAAGFNDVAETYDTTPQRVALTTGLFMMGLGVGSVVASPTAILFGKRPVYLFSAMMFIASSIWCALAPNFNNLIVARILQGMAISPVECLPSATIAEVFFLHERAFRVGIYTLLLLGGKNLVPLVSAAIIQSLEWRWVFWIVALVAGLGLALLFLFVPETFWDRTPRPKSRRPHAAHHSFTNLLKPLATAKSKERVVSRTPSINMEDAVKTPRQKRLHDLNAHARFAGVDADAPQDQKTHVDAPSDDQARLDTSANAQNEERKNETDYDGKPSDPGTTGSGTPSIVTDHGATDSNTSQIADRGAHALNEKSDPEAALPSAQDSQFIPNTPMRYTTFMQTSPPKTFTQTLKPWNGRLSKSNWFLVMLRPFVLFAYPSILWSTAVYSLSVGWLIVLSESVAEIYRSSETYNFSALGTGLVYLSPFVGGVLGTAVAGKVSDIIVRFMSKRNGGVYEPEFRLLMALPIAISTGIGLMGFGWSAEERDHWIVPTVFFGIISFGCSLGSTTAITFCVDSYRQYAGEALVTLNFSKNIFHGLAFSLFFPQWLHEDGSKEVFLIIGGIQVAVLLTTIPMYIFGKRARMMTVRKNWLEKF